MQDPTDDSDVAISVGPDPLDQLLKGIGVGEDVVRGLPIISARSAAGCG